MIFDLPISRCVKKIKVFVKKTQQKEKMVCRPQKPIDILSFRPRNRMYRFWGPFKEV